MNVPAAAAAVRPSPTRLSGWPQRLLHLVALIAGWGLFFWGWYDVSAQPWDTKALTWLIVGSLVTLPVITIAWVLHNVGIHRRKGPRTKLRDVDETYSQDWNGREIAADFPALARAHIIVIDIEGNRKVYAAGPLAVQRVAGSARHGRASTLASDEDASEGAGLRAA